ncbi:MAG TPA: hypothetical protein VMR25_21980, partial [Planctomycetaceae bacterium]|nr:hypothetical protein [Planctomycetaceae bacterium]
MDTPRQVTCNDSQSPFLAWDSHRMNLADDQGLKRSPCNSCLLGELKQFIVVRARMRISATDADLTRGDCTFCNATVENAAV